MKRNARRGIGAIVFAAALPFLSGPLFSRTPLVVCCAGDSIMRPMPALFRTLDPSARPALEFREWAQGGLDSETYLSYFRRNLPRWTGAPCDAILLQLGTNDAWLLLEGKRSPEEFRAGIVAVLGEFKKFRSSAGSPPALFLATVPFFCDRPETAGLNKIVESVVNPVLGEIAAAEGAVLVDQNLVLRNRPEWTDPDCIHPNSAGEKALALSWLKTVREVFFEENRESYFRNPRALSNASTFGSRPRKAL